MRCRAMLMLAIAVAVRWSVVHAEPASPDGTWLVGQRVAFNVFACKDALCGRIEWLRNPALRTSEMCGRTIIWGLTADGPADWNNGWFFDPEARPHRDPDADAQSAGLVRNGPRPLVRVREFERSAE